MLTAAPLESRRFGLRIFRASLSTLDAAELLESLSANDVDVAIVRLPTTASHGIHALADYGLHGIHADTLVTYECDLLKHGPAALRNPPASLEPAHAAESTAIAEMVRIVFADYPSHYAANPLLSREGALEGYREWALAHLDAKNCVTWIMRIDGKVAAFACNAFDEATRTCQGVLYGVHPDFAGRGIYTDLIRHTQQHFKTLGCMRMRVQTQIGNLAVQRAWARDGFVFANAQETFHVNALLDRNRPGCTATDFRWEENCAGLETPTSRFLSAAAVLLDPEHGFSKSGSACNAALIRNPPAASACVLRLCRYAPAQLPGRMIASVTLHDADDRLCGIAHFRNDAASAMETIP